MSNVIFEGGDYLDNLTLNLKKQHPELSAITKEMIKLNSCKVLDGDNDHNTTATIAIDGFAGTVDVKYTRVNLSLIYQGFYEIEVPMFSDDNKVSNLEIFKAFCLSAGIPYHDGVIADPDGRVDISTATDGTYPILTSCPYFIAENNALKIRAVSKKVVDLATISIDNAEPFMANNGPNGF